jgi:hypothetical protein
VSEPTVGARAYSTVGISLPMLYAPVPTIPEAPLTGCAQKAAHPENGGAAMKTRMLEPMALPSPAMPVKLDGMKTTFVPSK